MNLIKIEKKIDKNNYQTKTMQRDAIFKLSIVFDDTIDFFSLIVRPLDKCNKVYNYLNELSNSERVMSIPFINGRLTCTFAELSSYIEVDDDEVILLDEDIAQVVIAVIAAPVPSVARHDQRFDVLEHR